MAPCAVLVVDDNDVIRSTIKTLLEYTGYAVESACNGLEALAEVERRLPEIILLDMRMPIMDGWGFARAVHELRLNVKLVVMTAETDIARYAMEVQADSYLAKPFDLAQLLTELDRLTLG